jgi:adenylate cyclase
MSDDDGWHVGSGDTAGVVAFTDIVGFTEFTATEGDNRALELLDAQRSIVDAHLPADARVVKDLGDGLLLWIDRPRNAIELSLTLQIAFRDVAERESLPLWVRIGMHWGRPARRGDDLVGHDVNTASRITDQAGPGEVLASEALVEQCDLSAGGIACSPVGPVRMKGIPDAIWLYRLG